MKSLSKNLIGVVVVVALASSLVVLAGCSSSGGSSSSAAESSTSSSSEQIANPWSDVASAAEAAKGAGLDAFALPEGAIADMGEPIAIHYRCMDGMAEAIIEFPAAQITARTAKVADGDSLDISGDYNSYSKEWTETIGDESVSCAGNRDGESVKTYWGGDGIAHSLVAEGLGGDDDFGVTLDRLTVFVEGMK